MSAIPIANLIGTNMKIRWRTLFGRIISFSEILFPFDRAHTHTHNTRMKVTQRLFLSLSLIILNKLFSQIFICLYPSDRWINTSSRSQHAILATYTYMAEFVRLLCIGGWLPKFTTWYLHSNRLLSNVVNTSFRSPFVRVHNVMRIIIWHGKRVS